MDTFYSGDTREFTWISSLQIAPDAAPVLVVFAPMVPGQGAVAIASITAVQSDTTHYAALFTMPMSEGIYGATWWAQKTLSGSARTFVDPFLFRVSSLRPI